MTKTEFATQMEFLNLQTKKQQDFMNLGEKSDS